MGRGVSLMLPQSGLETVEGRGFNNWCWETVPDVNRSLTKVVCLKNRMAVVLEEFEAIIASPTGHTCQQCQCECHRTVGHLESWECCLFAYHSSYACQVLMCTCFIRSLLPPSFWHMAANCRKPQLAGVTFIRKVPKSTEKCRKAPKSAEKHQKAPKKCWKAHKKCRKAPNLDQ